MTRTSPGVTRRIRQECVPSRNTSPAIDSMAKSSFTLPTGRVVGLGDHAVVADFGDRAAARERREPRAAAGPQHAVDAVAVQVGHALAPAGA